MEKEKLKKIISNEIENISVESVFNVFTGEYETDVRVGDYFTKIIKKNDGLFYFHTLTTPKCFIIDNGKGFKTIEEAVEEYLIGIRISFEDHLEILKDHVLFNWEIKSKDHPHHFTL